MKWLSRAAVGTAALVLYASAAPTGSQAQPPADLDHQRFEYSRRLDWAAAVDDGRPSTFTLLEREIETPASTSEVDVVVTISLDFAASRGDFGKVGAWYRGAEDDGGLSAFRPPSLGRLVSPSGRQLTTTSVTWVRRGLEGGGRAYDVQIGVAARDRDSDGSASIYGKSFSVVIDVLPAD